MKKKEEIQYLISNEDKIEMQRLAKVAVASNNDCESIYHLFKKYVNPKAAMYSLTCACYTSISNYWQLLMEFYSQNNNKTI